MKFKRRASKALSVLYLALIHHTAAWHSQGHLVTAEIGRQYLKSTPRGQAALIWANKILSTITKFCGENLYPFTESATYADKLKEMGWKTMNEWHFKNTPVFIPSDFRPPVDPTPQDLNIVKAINTIKNHLSSAKVYADLKYGSAYQDVPKSMSLRFLIHFLGDIHQPLHVATMYSKDFPTNDLGGNLFMIEFPAGTKRNLHFVWDELMGQGKEVFSPLSLADYGLVARTSEDLMREHPYESLHEDLKKYSSVEAWSERSFLLAKDHVYQGIKQHEPLPSDYVKRSQEIINKQLALGGYRLGDTIIEVYEQYLRNKENHKKKSSEHEHDHCNCRETERKSNKTAKRL